MNLQIEKDHVLNPCLKLCKKLHINGTILQYRRLDVFDKTHISGSPDIEVWVPKEEIIWIIMCECKRPIGGIFSPKQKSYREKYCKFKNVIYAGITDSKQLNDLVFRISDYGTEFKEKLKEMELWNH